MDRIELVWNNSDASLGRSVVPVIRPFIPVHLFFETNRSNYPIVVSKVFWIELFLTRTWSRRIIKISWILVHGCRYIYIYFSILFKKLDEINFYRSTIESNGSKEETTRSKARDNKTLIGQTVVEGYTQQWAIKIGINSGKRNAQGRERGWLCEVITSDLETRSPYE